MQDIFSLSRAPAQLIQFIFHVMVTLAIIINEVLSDSLLFYTKSAIPVSGVIREFDF